MDCIKDAEKVVPQTPNHTIGLKQIIKMWIMSLSTADKRYFNLHIKGYKVDRIYLFVKYSASIWNQATLLRNLHRN